MRRSLLPALFVALSPMAISLAAPLPPAATEALRMIERAADASRSDAVLIMRGGHTLLERTSEAGRAPIELMSVTKSVVALGVGCLLSDGLLESIDVPVHRFYPEWKQGRKQAITVRMLLDNTSGLQNELRPAVEIYPAPDVVQLALAAELSNDPGARYAYNNKAVNLLAGVIAKAAGEPMDRYLGRCLFAPLGIPTPDWYKDSAGNPHAMAGLSLQARDAAKIGRLVLDRGRFDDRQLLPASHVDELLAPHRLSADAGMLWMRNVAWVRFHADDASIRIIEQAGVSASFVDALRPLAGRRFNDPDQLFAALADRLGDDWFDRWHAELIVDHGIGPWRPFHPEKGPVELYSANGSFGQYIVVAPKAQLVAVRQIVHRDSYAEGDGYELFIAHVQALADALAPTSTSAP